MGDLDFRCAIAWFVTPVEGRFLPGVRFRRGFLKSPHCRPNWREPGAFLTDPPRFVATAESQVGIWGRQAEPTGGVCVEEGRFQVPFQPASDLAVSPDGRFIALAKLRAPPVFRWDVEREVELQVLD